MSKRKYTKRERAKNEQLTRERIIEAAMALHEELGPALTSIKAVAERAGVQRLTVYRHFPDEMKLFSACTSQWLTLHPLPEIDHWRDIDDPGEKTRKVVLAFYRYYRQTERMWHVAYRDVDEVEALQAPMAEIEKYLDTVSRELVIAWQPSQAEKKTLSPTLRHGLRFSTWQSLGKEKLSDSKMVELVMNWLGRGTEK